jgi:Cd2+/Zn2+-exporting ATPase
MTNNSPCGCGHDHEEEKDAPIANDEGGCCGGGCHDCGDDSQDDDACGCGHDCGDDNSQEDACGCGHEHAPTITPEELEKLKASITAAGYKFEETPEGEIRILEK